MNKSISTLLMTKCKLQPHKRHPPILCVWVGGCVVAFITSSCVATVSGKIVDYILDWFP